MLIREGRRVLFPIRSLRRRMARLEHAWLYQGLAYDTADDTERRRLRESIAYGWSVSPDDLPLKIKETP